jgi:hypothetical protein
VKHTYQKKLISETKENFTEAEKSRELFPYAPRFYVFESILTSAKSWFIFLRVEFQMN